MARKRLRLSKRLIVILALTAVAPLLGVRVYREYRGFLWHTFGFNETFASPERTTRLKVVITDQGALGWGCIKFYRYSLLTGYSFVSRHREAVAQAEATVQWTDETQCVVTYTDPKEGLVTRRLNLR